MSELYSIETIANALGLLHDYVRDGVREYVARTGVDCAACGKRVPVEKWGARCGCPEGLQLQIDSLRERVGELEQARVATRVVERTMFPERFAHFNLTVERAGPVGGLPDEIAVPPDYQPRQGVLPNPRLDPLGASLAEREG